MSPERIDFADPRTDRAERDEHEMRYRFAAGFCRAQDTVLDAACGTGYGRAFLPGSWVGVDRNPPPDAVEADLETWGGPVFDFDVFVGLETIEHLADAEAYVALAHRARRFIVISTPVIRTTHTNEWHLRDWSPTEIVETFATNGFRLLGELRQGGVYGLWAFVRTPLA